MDFYEVQNTQKAYIFRKAIPSGASGYLDMNIVGHGWVDSVRVRCATGDQAMLHIRPVVIIPQEIEIDLFAYAPGGEKYISGDDETIENKVRYEVENHAVLRVYYDNTDTDPLSDDAQLSVDISIIYAEYSEPENIIGPRRGRVI